MNRLPAWRIAAGLAALAVLAGTAVLLAPVYVRNLQLQSFLRGTPPASDQEIEQALLNQAWSLNLDIAPDHIQIQRSATGGPAQVRYVIRVTLPLYTVDLHFSSSVGEGRR